MGSKPKQKVFYCICSDCGNHIGDINYTNFHLPKVECANCGKLVVDEMFNDNYSYLIKIQRIVNRIVVNGYLYNRGCIHSECKCNDPDMLSFHHVDPSKKESGISDMVFTTYSIDKLIDEMDKCVVLCHNHHHKLHALLRRKKNLKDFGYTIDK